MSEPVPAEPKPSNLLNQMRALGIWPNDPNEQHTVDEIAGRTADDRQIARQLIDRDLLTSYQANKILTGDAQALVIGPYVILERLGEGGMGRVYKARHQRLQKVVALKVIRSERLANPVAIKRFFREIESIGKLRHANIVWAFDAGQMGELHFFAMQYVPGRDMSRLVKEGGPLDINQAVEFFRQAALGLQHIHEHGMVHRDIKPSNLLVVEAKGSGSDSSSSSHSLTATVKIVDLGLTRGPDSEDASRLTQMGTTMGTVDYMSPEQARASHDVDIRSDIYSLGCSMYFALAGRPPFVADSPVEKMMAHQMDQPPPLDQLRPNVPPVLVAIVRRMMAKKAGDRFQTPQEVADALDAFRRNAPVNLGPTPATPVRALPVNAPPPPPKAVPVEAAPADAFGFVDAPHTPAFSGTHKRSRKRGNDFRWVKIAGVIGAGILVLIVALWLALR